MSNKIIEVEYTDSLSSEDIYIDIDMIAKQFNNSYLLETNLGRLVNVRAVQNSLDNIFNWIPGERILNPEFGSRLKELLYEGITDRTKELVVAEIRSCVQKFEPRVNITKITNIDSIQNAGDNAIELDINYTINGLEDRIFHKQYYFNRH